MELTLTGVHQDSAVCIMKSRIVCINQTACQYQLFYYMNTKTTMHAF